MEKIIIDTNFLLIPAQFGIDIFSEISRIAVFPYKLYIVDKTLDELDSIINTQKGRDKDAAKLALTLIKAKDINMIPTAKHKNVDNLILELVETDKYIVATQDKAFQSRLKQKNVKIISMRQKKYLTLR